MHCRQARTVVHEFLAQWCTFTLIEQQIYVRFGRDPSTPVEPAELQYGERFLNEHFDLENLVGEEEEGPQPPQYFFIVRALLRPPCLVLKVAFLGGLRGALRHAIMDELRQGLLNLRVRQRTASGGGLLMESSGMPLMYVEPAVALTVKPIERVLVRYLTIPRTLRYIVRVERGIRDEEIARNTVTQNALARYYRYFKLQLSFHVNLPLRHLCKFLHKTYYETLLSCAKIEHSDVFLSQ